MSSSVPLYQRQLHRARSFSSFRLPLVGVLVLAVFAGLAYMKFGRRPAPLDQTLTAQFPVLTKSLASRSTEFKPSVRRVDGRDVAGLVAHPVDKAAVRSKSDRDQAMPAGLKAVEQEALRLASERNDSDELAAFFPNEFSQPFVVELAGISVAVRPLEALPAHASIENGKVVYRDVYRETDSLHAVSTGRSEEFLYLRSPNAPRRFEYELSEINGAREVKLEAGAVHFKNDAGGGLQIEAPWVVDASGQRREDVMRWELGVADEIGKRRLSLVVEDKAELSYPLVIDPSWMPSGMITPRSSHTATLLPDGKVLVTGGSTDGGRTTTAELYDPATGGWTSTGSLSIDRVNHTATLLPNGKVLVVGGGPTLQIGPDGALFTIPIAELYDPATGTWSTTGSLVKARESHTATLLSNGKVLIAGGLNPLYIPPDNGILGSAELYDPASGTFSSTGALTVARTSHTATLLPNGKALVIGGIFDVTLASAEIYDSASGTWSFTNHPSQRRSGHTATLLANGKVLVAGGHAGAFGYVAGSELYDPAADSWSPTGALNNARSLHEAVLLPNGKVLVIGGSAGGPVPVFSAELYDPVPGTWSLTNSPQMGRTNHTATLLPNGTVLVAGGYGGSGSFLDDLGSAELYNPASGRWGLKMNAPRRSHTSTLLPNGKVLIAGGLPNGAELYDPATGTWAVTAPILIERLEHTATLLANGKVLVTGGIYNDRIGTAELYDPASGTWSFTASQHYPRNRHTATLLANGKVLIVGGANATDPSAELYDPASRTFSATGSLGTNRSRHTATLLPNGKVLVAGGTNSSGILAGAELYDPATGIWTTTGSLNPGDYEHTATLLPNGKVLLVGYFAGAQLYDPGTGTWSVAGSLPDGRNRHTATLLPNGKVLVAGGDATRESAVLYDPNAGTWSSAASLSVPRTEHTATLLANGKVLVTGGYDGHQGTLNSAELYDSAVGTWSSTGPLTNTRLGHGASLLPNGKVLIAGGSSGSIFSGFVVRNSAEVYDMAAGTWSPTGSLVQARSGHTTTLLANGKVLVAGGFDANFNSLVSAELYDPATGTWSATGSFSLPRSGHTATLLTNGRVLVAGGNFGAGPLVQAELYDPATGTWTATGSLSVPRELHTATLLPNGKVLVAGGNHSLGGAELYDSATGMWSATGSLSTPRSGHTATLLPNGKVLVVAGRSFIYLGSVELYDPSTGTWSATGSLHTLRSGHTTTLLPNGTVLAAGGVNDSGPLASAELYDPVTGAWLLTASLNPRRLHTSTLLVNGKVLITGGSDGNDLATSQLYDVGLGYPASSQPIINSATSPLALATTKLALTGTRFRGISGSSSDNNRNSSTNYPVVQLRSLNSDQTRWLSSDPTTPWSDTSITSQTVGNFPTGYALVTVFTNAIPSESKVIQIIRGAQTITVNTHAPASAAYNSSFTVAATASSGLPISYSSSGVCTNVGPLFTMTASTGMCTVRYDQSGDSNYSAAPQVTESVAAVKANQTITVTTHPPATSLNNASFTVVATSTSGLAVSYSSAGVCTNVGPVFTMTSNTGTCTVKYDQAGNGNYNAATQVTETVTAQKISQTITFNGIPDKVTGDPDFTVSATASSNLAVSFTASGPCTLSGSTIHLTGRGQCTITASQAGNTDYNAAPNVIRTFIIRMSRPTGSLGTERSRHTATLLGNGRVLVVGGARGNGDSLASTELYDRATGTWTTSGSLATPRDEHTATLLPNGKVLVVGGFQKAGGSSVILNSAELYDPGLGTWSATGPLATARYRHTATLLANGKVLVVGGNDSGVLGSAELYDPSLGVWSSAGTLNAPRRYHTATLLLDGKVLVAGGENSIQLASTELFDPIAGTWSATGNFITRRKLHSATLLPNGKVLAAGGVSSSGTPPPSKSLSCMTRRQVVGARPAS